LLIIILSRWIAYWLKKNAARNEYKEALTKMLCNLFYDKVSQSLQDLDSDSSTEPMDVTVYTGTDFMRHQMLLRKRDEVEDTANDKKEIADRVEQILKKEVDDYYNYITNVDYVDLIQRYSSALYNEATFNRDQVLQVKDPIYLASMFDAFAWWRSYGRESFKFIELCDLIVFVKPIHNGFQERVFSRGTFTDDQLRRKMKEETFELAILEAINCNTVDKYMAYFKQKNMVDPTKVASSADKYIQHIKKGKLQK
jgi:hypothetical protein